jgi:ATP-dependent Lhr-like helicase
VAVANAGTIPDRGLFGVFLVGATAGSGRVGELDEEMVFESRVGETFLLGASTWRIEEITHDRVLVSPAPGEPGKMPFWKGDQAGRPRELGFAIGKLARELREVPAPVAIDRLMRLHDLDRVAADNLLQYLADQVAATGSVPDDRACLAPPTGRRESMNWHDRCQLNTEAVVRSRRARRSAPTLALRSGAMADACPPDRTQLR